MRTEEQWTDWGDEHPWLAGLAQLGIYAILWVGVILSILMVVGMLYLFFLFVGALGG